MISGLCWCGCGGRTPLASRTSRGRGLRKGEPTRFVRGHESIGRRFSRIGFNRIRAGEGYMAVRQPAHPRAHNGYIYEHVSVAERAVGHVLPKGAVVHHVNGDRADNSRGNLVICQDQEYHMLLHRRAKALREGGHPDARQCWICKTWSMPGPGFTVRTPRSAYHKSCASEYARERKSA